MSNRSCEWCGAPLVRRDTEKPYRYRQRRFCGRSCALRRRRDAPESPNPSGLCLCGCGHATRIAESTNYRGDVKGQPRRYLRGHQLSAIRPARGESPLPVLVEGQHYDVAGDGCWVWRRQINDGYGKLTRGRDGRERVFQAHRVAYANHVGPIPAGMHVHHRCGNRRCVNPAHLELLSPRRHGRTPTRQFKLTANQVAAIRRRYSAGELQADLADAFGVHPSTISRIVTAKSWA